MPQTDCKLCRSFAASEMSTAAERELPGSDSFTRHPDICDACLNCDYAARSRSGTVEQWGGLTLGLLVALIATASAFAMYRRELHDFLSSVPRSLRVPVALVLIAIPSVALCMLLAQLPFWFVSRRSKANTDESRIAIDAERFRWLAAWGTATGNHQFSRRMMKKADALRVTSKPREVDKG